MTQNAQHPDSARRGPHAAAVRRGPRASVARRRPARGSESRRLRERTGAGAGPGPRIAPRPARGGGRAALPRRPRTRRRLSRADPVAGAGRRTGAGRAPPSGYPARTRPARGGARGRGLVPERRHPLPRRILLLEAERLRPRRLWPGRAAPRPARPPRAGARPLSLPSRGEQRPVRDTDALRRTPLGQRTLRDPGCRAGTLLAAGLGGRPAGDPLRRHSASRRDGLPQRRAPAYFRRRPRAYFRRRPRGRSSKARACSAGTGAPTR